VIEYAIFLCVLAQQWGHDKNKIWHTGNLGVRVMPECQVRT